MPVPISSEIAGVFRYVAADLLGCEPVDIDPYKSLAEYGFDSLDVTRILSEIESLFNLRNTGVIARPQDSPITVLAAAIQLLDEFRAATDVARRLAALADDGLVSLNPQYFGDNPKALFVR